MCIILPVRVRAHNKIINATPHRNLLRLLPGSSYMQYAACTLDMRILLCSIATIRGTRVQQNGGTMQTQSRGLAAMSQRLESRKCISRFIAGHRFQLSQRGFYVLDPPLVYTYICLWLKQQTISTKEDEYLLRQHVVQKILL